MAVIIRALAVREETGEMDPTEIATLKAGLVTGTGRRQRVVAGIAVFGGAQAIGKKRGQRVAAFKAMFLTRKLKVDGRGLRVRRRGRRGAD